VMKRRIRIRIGVVSFIDSGFLSASSLEMEHALGASDPLQK